MKKFSLVLSNWKITIFALINAYNYPVCSYFSSHNARENCGDFFVSQGQGIVAPKYGILDAIMLIF